MYSTTTFIRDISGQKRGDIEIIKGLNLTIPAGEVHAIMGPNGSGKSTLSYVLSGREGYEVTRGSITYNGQDLLEMDASERAQAGMSLSVRTKKWAKINVINGTKLIAMPAKLESKSVWAQLSSENGSAFVKKPMPKL